MPASEVPGLIEFLVPGDPEQNTGGYRYVRKLVQTLNEQGQNARVTGLPGRFPRPDDQARQALDWQLCQMPAGTWVVLDGLAMGGLPDIVEKHHERLKLLALVHHPLADETGLDEAEKQWFYESEKRALGFVTGTITTSHHTAQRLVDYGVGQGEVRVAEPGVAEAAEMPRVGGRAQGPSHLLCVAHLSPRKAQHHLVEALQSLATLPWECTLAGSCSRDPGYAESVRRLIAKAGLEQRITLTGELEDDELAGLYHRADFFVFPSLYEGYGMVIDEALAAGLPIISSNGGALADTAARPGVVQFEAGDVYALSSRIRNWLENPKELAQARNLACGESGQIRTWQDTADDFSGALYYFGRFHKHSVFAVNWLRARESADHRARSRKLTNRLSHWLEQDYKSRSAENRVQPPLIVDIGAGRGSNAMFLVRTLQVPQTWLAIDQDAELLREAKQRVETLGVPYKTDVIQLTPGNMEEHLPEAASLITASALIDLVSEAWLSTLVEAAAVRKSAVLVVLSYAGSFELSPAHPDDSMLRDLVNRHQHGDKGAGAALGPDAVEALQELLAAKGYRVKLDESPWQLDTDDSSLIRMLMEGWVEAATEIDPRSGERLRTWLQSRSAQLAEGALKVSVNHIDLLALPPEEASWQA
ncbi:MAG: glycosyltransferase [Pseudomonadota bacterium]